MNLTAPIGRTQSLAVLLLLLGALFNALSSLGFQHIGGFQPCQLCYIQRYVHYSMIPASLVLLGLIWQGAPAWLTRVAFLALFALLGYGWAVGIYQAGAEWEFWLGPNDCANTVTISNNASSLFESLGQTKLIRCDVAQLRILGLSFGGWNVVISTVLMAIALGGALLGKDAIDPIIKRIPLIGLLTSAISKD
ncbi:Disulfide bond formation protein DsbB [Cohaesibacter sp. ES.047]|uniref:disulfide bond formation protein B n=1 Tax=Cohaesibacter sp. ES.047 TaxID=1798205 RepID=UPI000BB7E6F2|nr:disulfide bond formation protein B [Cohaesibacter sp. ES.047]SNY90831.1 Disulfide bond formation protein DsbB [Cohaesibacter sp. ES.047]